MTSSFLWNDVAVPFRPGETIAAALLRAGIISLGSDGGRLSGRIFCGIGACQGCTIAVEGGAPVEACLTPARTGLRLSPVPGLGAGHA